MTREKMDNTLRRKLIISTITKTGRTMRSISVDIVRNCIDQLSLEPKWAIKTARKFGRIRHHWYSISEPFISKDVRIEKLKSPYFKYSLIFNILPSIMSDGAMTWAPAWNRLDTFWVPIFYIVPLRMLLTTLQVSQYSPRYQCVPQVWGVRNGHD